MMLANLLQPAADSVACQRNKDGKAMGAILWNLIWAFWFFGDLMYEPALEAPWIIATLIGFPATVALWLFGFTHSDRHINYYATAMALLGYSVLPWNHSGGTCCIIYAATLFAFRGPVRICLLRMITLVVIFAIETLALHWPAAIIVGMTSMTFAIAGGNLARRLNEQKDAEIRLSHDEVRRLASLAERERIGRDLHDLLGHTLSLITIKSELANKLFDRDSAAAKREMIDVERVARDALAQVRRAVTGIRAAGFAAELASAKLLLESNGTALTYAVAEVALPVEVETVLAMAVREAVTNIQRHARATHVQVALETASGKLLLRIEDNGRGGAIVPGNGLSGMRERLATIDAQLSVESQRGAGTKVIVRMPMPASRAMGADALQSFRQA